LPNPSAGFGRSGLPGSAGPCRIKARTERVGKPSYSLGLKIRVETGEGGMQGPAAPASLS